MNAMENGGAPKRITRSDRYEGPFIQLIQLTNGELLLFNRESDIGHNAPDGRIVQRRSTDLGSSWSDPTTIRNPNEKDVLNPSVIYSPESDRIVLFDYTAGFTERIEGPSDLFPRPGRKDFDTHVSMSEDNGHTWTNPQSISNLLVGERIVPFGGGVRNSRGIHSFFYSNEYQLQVLRSDDGGKTWNNHSMVTDSPPGKDMCEPVPCLISDEKMMLFGRDNASGDFFSIKSRTGGETWSGLQFFNPANTPSPKPVWVGKPRSNRVTAVWGDRDDGYLYSLNMSAQLVWQDSTEMENEQIARVHKHINRSSRTKYWDGNAGDFGYPTVLLLNSGRNSLMVFYDEPPWPNLWQMALPF